MNTETTETAEQTFTVPAENLPRFEQEMKKLLRRAKKLAVLDLIGYEVTRTHTHERKYVDSLGIVRDITVVLHDVRAWGPVVKLDGWALIGRLDFKAVPGATLRMMVPGESCPPSFYDASATRCDHCGHARKRNDSFIVRHDDGREMVVGRTCLGDFLGRESAESLARLAELPALVRFAGEESEGWGGLGGYREAVWNATQVLATSFYAVRKWGWSPSREDGSTRETVLDLLTPSNFPQAEQQRIKALEEVTDRDWQRASAAIAWVAGLDTRSDYMHNLKAVLTGAVICKTMGIAVSGAVAFDRHEGREAKRTADAKRTAATGASTHVGSAGDRVDFDAETIFVMAKDGYYGTTTIIKLRDDAGNVYTWFASGSKDVERGQRYTVRGTVKKHDEYRGEKQTIITRCKLSKAA